MYTPVHVPRRKLDDHRRYVEEEILEEIRSVASGLRGARILNLSLSPFGTGVAELLHGLVPLIRDLGLEADWQVVRDEGESCRAIRLMYEGLSGRRVDWTPEALESWRLCSAASAGMFDDSYDIVVIHDPQPAGLLPALEERGGKARNGKWVWHCHLDLRQAQPEVWESFLPTLRHYDAWVVADPSFTPSPLPDFSPRVIAPAIDPTHPRNAELGTRAIRELLTTHGLDWRQPLLVQIGPLDPSFDPMGAIDAYREAKAERPGLQLMLIQPTVESSMEAWSRFEQVARHAGGDSSARVLAGQGEVGHTLVNAAQRAASVVLQRSVPAGFATTLWEAQWKGRPVVAGRTGGLAAQLADGETGYLAATQHSFVEAILALLADPPHASRIGAAAREAVRRRQLITRYLLEELRLFKQLVDGARPRSS